MKSSGRHRQYKQRLVLQNYNGANCCENISTICLTVLTQYRTITDRQTGANTDYIRLACIFMNECGCAMKMSDLKEGKQIPREQMQHTVITKCIFWQKKLATLCKSGLAQIKRHPFTFERDSTALCLTTKTGKTGSRLQKSKVLINTTK